MALKTVSVILTGNATSLRAALVASAREVQTFGDQVDKVGDKGHKVGQALAAGFKIAAVGIAIALAASVASAAQFEERMRNVNSISALGEAQFAGLSSKVLDLSRTLPQTANNLAEGLYEIASSGFQGAEGLEVLEKAAQAASAGLTTTQTSAKAIVGVLNAYGLEAADAARVSDVLFQTVNLGVISFEELSQNLGDVIGLAAAAGVSIEEVGAAIAAITLAGVPAAEAFTALNILTKSLIKPSDELATVYRALGINITRDLKDPAIGLRGVMEQLRVATGGNVDAFIALFPEIRAAKGAFALAANDGENYARTTAGITDKTKTAGATMRAFDEQMKAVSNQFRVFVNGVQAGAIELGTHLLPILADTLKSTRELAHDAMPGLKGALAALSPFFTAVTQVGGDLVDIARQLVDGLGPVAKVIAGIVAGGVIGALNGLAEILSAVTGFLADHAEVVTGAAAAYVAWKVALAIDAVLSSVAGGTWILRAAVSSLGDAFATSAGRVALLKSALAATGLGALVLTLGSIATAYTNAGSAADDFVGGLRDAADLTTNQGMHEYLAALKAQEQEFLNNGKATSGWAGALRRAADALPIIDNGTVENARTLAKTREEFDRAAEAAVNFAENSVSVSEKTGLSVKAVDDLATVLKVDLTKGFDASGEARQKLIDYYDELVTKARGSSEGIKDAAAVDMAALEEQKAAVDALVGKVAEAFAGATDVIAGFSASVAKEKGLETFLAENLAAAEQFAADIQVATEKGLNPTLITKLLKAGPEAAAPFLQAIAADHSGNLVALANETEAALDQINTKVVAFARLTQQAINDTDDSKLRALGDAMRIQAEIFDREGARTRNALVEKLQIPIERVESAIKEFGLTVAENMPTVAAATDVAAAFGQALDQLPAKLVENGRTLDESTAAGQRNRDAIEEVVTKAGEHVAALEGQGATMDQQRSAFDRHLADLRAVLEQAGYTTAEIDAYIATLGRIPGSVSTDIVTNHIDNYVQQGSGREYGPGMSGVQVARGGIIHYYAAGGFEDHVAQIAPRGVTRIWNEPETDGEAYIPYAMAKRGRSSRILATVASDFGYDLTPRRSGQMGDVRRYATGGPAGVTTTTGPPIDYDRLAQALAREMAGVTVVADVGQVSRALHGRGRGRS